MDTRPCGTLAEIGAGQETVRWFFKVGGAAGSIAKAMSAYDMKFSDSIFGPCPASAMSAADARSQCWTRHIPWSNKGSGSYVAATALFSLLLTPFRPSATQQRTGHRWLGIRFQTEPRAPA